MKTNEKPLTRREPKQQRSRQTMEVVVEAVQRVLKRHPAEAITTNRIAEAAGVSIGSLYHYFPDKQAIFAALPERHVDEVRQVIERTSAHCTAAALEELTRELVERLANVHAEDAELHEVVSRAVPEGPQGFRSALHATFEQVLAPTEQDRYTPEETKAPRASLARERA
jgi:AcrR family transcriptional regulator